MTRQTTRRQAVAGAVAVLTSAALVLTGCSSGDGRASDDVSRAPGSEPAAGFDAATMGTDYPMPEPGTAYNNPQERDALLDGGTLTLATSEVGPNWNSMSTDGNTLYMGTFWQYYMPQLWDYDVSGNPTPNPDYLTDVTVTSQDPLVVTYDLNPDARWNDGTDIDWTAFDVTWKAMSGKNEGFNPPSTAGYDQVAAVTRGDSPKQVVVTFATPFYPYQALFANLLHPDSADPTFFTEGWVNDPHNELGAGPFVVDSFDDTQATFVPNPRWWGDTPKLDKVVFRQMDASASVNAFQNGEIDATGVAAADRLTVAQGMDGVQIRVNYGLSTGVVTFNTTADSLQDIAVRKAVTQSVDSAKISEINFQGLGWNEEPAGSEVMYPFQDGYENNMPEGSAYSVESARATLEDAGYALDESTGYYAKDGTRVHVRYTFFGDSPVQTAIANAIQAMGKEAGIEIELDNQYPSRFSDVVVGGEYEMLLMGWSASDPYGYSTSGCQLYCSDSDSNFTYVGDPAIDAELTRAGQIEDIDEAIAQFNRAEKQALELYGTFPLNWGPVMTAVKAGLANYGPAGFQSLNLHPENIGWQK